MSNPVLNDKFLENERVLDSTPMTINGTINKTLILFLCLALAAGYTFSAFLSGYMDQAKMLTFGGAIVGFILALIIIFSRNKTVFKYLTPLYALAEGCFVGGISAFFEAQWHGIVLQAILGTFAVLFVMLMLYKARAIRYTEKFQAVLMTCMFSILAIYLIQIIASFFGRGIPLIWESGAVGIGFSLFVVVIAAMSLIQDFFFIESASQNMLSKDYEWYGAMGLMITLVWLYTEILRLLAKLNSRN